MNTGLDDDEDFEAALFMPADFPYDNLHEIAGVLEDARVFVPD